MDEIIEIWDGSIYKIELKETLWADKSKGVKMVNVRTVRGEWDEEIPLLIWDSGIIMSPKDWQTIQGETPEEILDRNYWIDIRTGKETAKINGVPW